MQGKRDFLAIKILLAIALVYLSFRLVFINETVDKAIHQQYVALTQLKNDPSLDSSANKNRYNREKSAINQQIDILEEKKYPNWYKFAGIIATFIAGLLITNITNTLFRKMKAKE